MFSFMPVFNSSLGSTFFNSFFFSDRVQTLSPIPSSTSLNTLKSANLSGAPTPLVAPVASLQQEEKNRRTSFQGMYTNLNLKALKDVFLSASLKFLDLVFVHRKHNFRSSIAYSFCSKFTFKSTRCC